MKSGLPCWAATDQGPQLWLPTFLLLTPHLVSPFTKCSMLFITGPSAGAGERWRGGVALRPGPAWAAFLPGAAWGSAEGRVPIRTEETPGTGSAALASVFTRLWHRAAPAWVPCQLTTPADCWHSFPVGASRGSQERRCKDGAPAKAAPVPGGSSLQQAPLGSEGRPDSSCPETRVSSLILKVVQGVSQPLPNPLRCHVNSMGPRACFLPCKLRQQRELMAGRGQGGRQERLWCAHVGSERSPRAGE